MRVLPREKKEVRFLICPKCEVKHNEVAQVDGKNWCSGCDSALYGGVDIPQDAWTLKKIDAIRCDRCNDLLDLDSEYDIPLEFHHVSCFRCNDSKSEFATSHLAAMEYNGEYYRPTEFLWDDTGKDGLLNVCGSKDKVTVSVLNHECKMEDFTFKSPDDPSALVKIFWRKGNALGYIWYSLPPTFSRPTLHHLFVLKDERRTGIATLMVEDFIKGCKHKPEDLLNVESPNEETLMLLQKMGYLDKNFHPISCIRIVDLG